jgi:hypothetical protein
VDSAFAHYTSSSHTAGVGVGNCHDVEERVNEVVLMMGLEDVADTVIGKWNARCAYCCGVLCGWWLVVVFVRTALARCDCPSLAPACVAPPRRYLLLHSYFMRWYAIVPIVKLSLLP